MTTFRTQIPTLNFSSRQVQPKKVFAPNQVVVYDTTLRDGSQAPGVNFSEKDRLEIAERLFKAGVDVIEAGFPASSPANAKSVKTIALTIGNKPSAPIICAFARTGIIDQDGKLIAKDIDAAWKAVKDAKYSRVLVCGSGSDLHLKEKYRSEGPNGRSRTKNIEVVRQSIAYLKNKIEANNKPVDIQFAAEDCGRADPKYLSQLFGAAIEAGATSILVPDTVGKCTPEEYGKLIHYLRENTPNGKNILWSTHTHNDLGLATANALSGLQAGAREMQGTFVGLGERAGNLNLEQALTIIKLYGDKLGQFFTNFDLKQLPQLCQFIAKLAKVPIAPSLPIVGRNAFRHKSGMHQDGILKNQKVYQEIPPEIVGREIELELGLDSGRAGLFYTLKQLGISIKEKDKRAFFEAFKKLADQIGMVDDTSLMKLGTKFPKEDQKELK